MYKVQIRDYYFTEEKIMGQFNMQFTLEEHFKNLSESYEQVTDVYCLWNLLKKDISEKLINTYRNYPYFSKHDASHSKTIITNIELFLGKERIQALSATDTIMLLICAYMHDYGMALDLEEIFSILNDSEDKFKNFLKGKKNENIYAKRILDYYNKEKSDGNLKELYYSILIMLQDLNRPYHWVGVEKIRHDYECLFAKRIKVRFVTAIIDICQMHGKNVEAISTLSRRSNGMFADVFHPRFIAAMIRLGDLLDLDNHRFSQEFERAMQKNDNLIPELSKIHYLKHESITNFLITPEYIDIEAICNGNDALALSVAREIYDWLHWLENDCIYLKQEWDMIAQKDFGTSPKIRNKKILVNGMEYHHFVYNLRMELPSDRIFELLIGSNVYENKYVAFREIIQNAIDATLLQIWENFYNNLPPNTLKSSYSSKLAEYCLSSNFDNEYKIQVNVIENIKENAVYVEVIDNGIGIGDEDLQYMCRIGENNICNPQRHKFIDQMPDWFIPSGVFGIGLQSAFQLTNEIEFFTKKANRTPRHIRFSSYSSNQGKIEVSKCPNSYLEQFNKLSTQGTLVRLKINPKFFRKNKDFDYFDLAFENEKLNSHVIFVEIIYQLKKYIETQKINYIPIFFSNYIIEDTTNISKKEKMKRISKDESFYYVMNMTETGQKIKLTKKNDFIILNYWNNDKNIFLEVQIPKCNILNPSDAKKILFSLQFLDNAFLIKYKHNIINNYEQLFGYRSSQTDTQVYDLNNNIIRCLVNIFDKNPENYLNIDRNVLKYGKITYSDIATCEEEMFSLFCSKVSEKKLLDGEKAFISKNDYLPILSILFFRFARKKALKSFILKYGKDLQNYEISLNNDGISYNIQLQKILGIENNNFFVYDIIESKYESFFNVEDVKNFEESQIKPIYVSDLYNYFPRHFFIPVKITIQKYNSKLCIIYECQIRMNTNQNNEQCFIDIDENYWKLDCISFSNANKSSSNKTVLKPISKYKYLIIKSFPKPFYKSTMFRNVLDQNISTYIIFPLEQNLTHQLYKCKECNSENDLKTILKEINNSMVKDPYFKKCLNYVRKNSCQPNTTDELIINDYKQLILDIGNEFFCLNNKKQ